MLNLHIEAKEHSYCATSTEFFNRFMDDYNIPRNAPNWASARAYDVVSDIMYSTIHDIAWMNFGISWGKPSSKELRDFFQYKDHDYERIKTWVIQEISRRDMDNPYLDKVIGRKRTSWKSVLKRFFDYY